jgi:hypothetical protein
MSSFQPEQPSPVDTTDALADIESLYAGVSDPPDLIVVEDDAPPIGLSWAFDFGENRFISGVGSGRGPLQTHGLATLITWAEKCLRTARGAHPIHPPGYGLVRPNDLWGKPVTGAPVAEMEARIRDALTFHPRITDVEDFEFDFDPNDEWVNVAFTMIVDEEVLVPTRTNFSVTSIGARNA